MGTALIIGSEGQDGTLLKQFLFKKGYKVYGIGRGNDSDSPWLEQYIQFDLADGDYKVVIDFIRNIQLNEIYYIAAFHHSSQEKNNEDQVHFVEQSVKVNQLGFVKVLEIVSLHSRQTKVFYTSSSLIFSGCGEEIQTEETKTEPRCIYAVTKCGAMEAAKYYRASHNIFVSIGIMYNHESILRKDHFLSKKIINETNEVLIGKKSFITVGDLSAITDWGYAPDYVKAMWHILQLSEPNTFIISSMETHTVQNWFEILFNHLQMDWKKFVIEDKILMTRKKPVLIGNNKKLLSTGWKPQVNFNEMVIKMFNNEI